MRGIRNSLPAGPCEYIFVTHMGSVKKGTAVLCSISRHLWRAMTSKHVSLLCFQREKKSSHPSQ